jgi:hypothetical protein
MAGTTPAAADPDIPAKEAQSRAPEESIEAAERLQPVHTNLRLLDPPKAMPSAYDAILRPLGLLDFVRLDLSASGVPRPDLVANYSSSRECSTVRGKKIEVSFKSFAKALCLPLYIVPVGSLKYGEVTATQCPGFTACPAGSTIPPSPWIRIRRGRRMVQILQLGYSGS